MKPTLIIPAYNPDNRLVTLVNQLKALGFDRIIVVDDGSTPDKKSIFENVSKLQGCLIISHPENRGKGAALKTGLAQALKLYPKSVGCVTADADGQHAPKDIAQVAETLRQCPFDLIMGVRQFTGRQVPFKSKWGNRITSVVFRLATGVTCSDTQTGLRGIPTYVIPSVLLTSGERFDYEMNTLLELANFDLKFVEVPIDTLYFDENKGTHFNPVLDSLKIYFNIFKYSCVSIGSAILDFYLFTMVMAFGGLGSFGATVVARLVSGIFNFTMNRNYVFKSSGKITLDGLKYGALFVVQMVLSAIFVTLLTEAGVQAIVAKLLVDGTLFSISYFIQEKCVFKHKTEVQ